MVGIALAFTTNCKSNDPPTKTKTTSRAPKKCKEQPRLKKTWNRIDGDFFEARIPASFHEVKVEQGRGYRDEGAHRRVHFSHLELPAGRMSAGQALEKLTKGVRKKADADKLKAKLGPTQKAGTRQLPIRYYLVQAKDRTLVQGLVGQKTKQGKLHAVLVIYEDGAPDATSTLSDCRAILETISLKEKGEASPTPAPSGSAEALPILTFTPVALAEIKKQTRPGETVWVGVKRQGAEVSYLLDVGERVPDDVKVIEIDGISVAIDRKSLAILRGTTIHFVPDAGFDFKNPNVK